MKGLAVLLVDYLASPKVDGYADEATIASDLRLSQKNIRKALRYLEAERLVAAETVKFAFKRKGVEEVDDPEVEERKRRETHVFWCLDYPRLVDALRLRMHRARATLRAQAEGADALQRYLCPRCGAQYSSLDASALVDFATGIFKCEDCGGELREHVEGPAGAAGAAAAASTRRERQAYFKDLLYRFDVQLKPITEQLERLKDTPAPDYGPLQDWYQGRQEEAARRAKRLEAARKKMAEAGGAATAELTDEQLLEWAERAEVVVALPGQEGPAAAAAAAEPAKELPAWFRTDDGAASASVGAGEAGGAAAAAAADADEARRRLEQQYLEQYLVQVRHAQAAMAAGVNGVGDDKGIKFEGADGVKSEPTAMEVDVKDETKREAGAEEIAWEDADAGAGGAAAAAAADGEEFDWEDA
jgi:transcription initiation factor TFIIE subunit alpha